MYPGDLAASSTTLCASGHRRAYVILSELSDGYESDGDGLGVGAGDVADGRRTVAVVLGLVGGVDAGLRVGRRFGEGDVTFGATGADAAGAAGLRLAVPGSVGAADGPHIHVVAGPNHPHRHVGTEASVVAK